MATLVSLDDALYSLVYWYNVAHKVADGVATTDTTDMNAWAQATATNFVTNAGLSTVSGYTGVKGSDLT
jgi:hypothetical protein